MLSFAQKVQFCTNLDKLINNFAAHKNDEILRYFSQPNYRFVPGTCECSIFWGTAGTRMNIHLTLDENKRDLGEKLRKISSIYIRYIRIDSKSRWNAIENIYSGPVDRKQGLLEHFLLRNCETTCELDLIAKVYVHPIFQHTASDDIL